MRRSEDVSEQGGYRRFLIAVLVAVVFGILLRLILAPAKIENIIKNKIEASDFRSQLRFAGAQISLADGWWPDFAVVLSGVEWRSSEKCLGLAPIRAKAVRVPFRILSLINGQASIGSMKIDDLAVDLDALKKDCGGGSSRKAPSVLAVPAPSVPSTPNAPAQVAPFGVPREVWSIEDQTRWSSLIRGVRVSRAEIFFEDRMKSVVLEDLSARWRGEAIDVSTSVRFPPATVFGENLPTFTVSGRVRRDEIHAEVRAELSE